MSKSIFDQTRGAADNNAELLAKTQQMFNTTRVATSEVAGYALSTESLKQEQISTVLTARGNLQTAIESYAGKNDNVLAATYAAMIAGNPVSYLSNTRAVPVGAISGLNVSDTVEGMGIALDAYDETNNKNLQSYSTFYNLRAARQDDFAEAFFPTVTISPDQAGIDISVRIMTVFSDKLRDLNGKTTDFEHKNVLRAYRNPGILKNEMTRAIPIVRAGSTQFFVPTTTVAPRVIKVDGENLTTAPLAAGKTFDLLSLSQRDSALTQSVQDSTDALHPAIKLTSLYVSINNGTDKDVLSFRIKDLPLTTFVQGNQNNYRNMVMNFESTSIMVNPTTKNVDGSALKVADEIATNNLFVRFRAVVTGNVNTQTGETTVFGNMFEVHTVRNSSGEYLPLDSGVGQAVVNSFSTAKIEGYDLEASVTNTNRRQRGNLVNIDYYTQVYTVPTRSPLTIIKPVLVDVMDNTDSVTSLINITNAYVSGAAVESLIEVANLLNEFINSDNHGETPDILGVSRKLIVPYYKHVDLDVTETISSLTSHERRIDIQSVLVNRIRDEVIRMYTLSEYQIALDAVNGGEGTKPTVIIGTDPITASYLNINGDNRILGDQFNCKIVQTVNGDVAGKVFITFSTGSTGTIDSMNFGNMLWQPALVFSSKMTRNGAYSFETTVSPRFAHIVHTPIMLTMNVTNIPDALERTPLLFKNV